MIRTICNYDSIEIPPNSLVAFDIDNTVIKFDNLNKKWWEDTKEKHGEETATNIWIETIKRSTASLIDESSFIRLMEKINDTQSGIVFITARDKSLKPYTMKHLEQANLYICPTVVYHSSHKGKTLLQIYKKKYSHLQKIIFVDDHMDNVEDVRDKLSHLNPDCYFLQHEKL
jgi:FMN phosphatase YigB (HAD superfamily)